MRDVGGKDVVFSILSIISAIASVFFILIFVGGCFGIASLFANSPARLNIKNIKYPVTKKSVLVLNLKGIIYDQKDFLDDLNHYIKEDAIKGVLIRLDSPGGGTTASQEVYTEILRLKVKYKKPVYVSIGNLGASGGFYVSMAADKIIANPSSILGSIGVIMPFSNYEKLYSWAKIRKYALKTGEFKDSGAQYRDITIRERAYFQSLMQEFLNHFKKVITSNRKLPSKLIDGLADGKVFTGWTAKKHGLIDELGSYYEALGMIGKATGLGEIPEIFEPLRPLDVNWSGFLKSSILSLLNLQILNVDVQNMQIHSQLIGKPLYLMPEHIGL